LPYLICRYAANHNAKNDFRQIFPKLSAFFPETFVTCLFAVRYDADISKEVGSVWNAFFSNKFSNLD